MFIIRESSLQKPEKTKPQPVVWAQVYDQAEKPRTYADEIRESVARNVGKTFIREFTVSVPDTDGRSHPLTIEQYIAWLDLQADRLVSVPYAGEEPPQAITPEVGSEPVRNLPA